MTYIIYLEEMLIDTLKVRLKLLSFTGCFGMKLDVLVSFPNLICWLDFEVSDVVDAPLAVSRLVNKSASCVCSDINSRCMYIDEFTLRLQVGSHGDE